ncbi:hypothetical protein [Methyloraptor flagellatus]|jgi:hypothetical protein|uniref:Secreted protein n=1 Tax=Methyloraptor flagellatus TaxID=3162530 RepID=A0AAU7XBK2_9HYPH
MKLNFAIMTGIAAGLVLGGSSISHAIDGQETYITLTETGFSNKSVKAAIQTTDFLADPTVCTTTNSNPCKNSEKQTSSPKNMGQVICIPNTMSVTLTSACQSLLLTGSGNNCTANPLANYCSSSTRGYASSCAWRTSTDKTQSATTNWTVTLNADGSGYSVDCSQSGYAYPFTSQ